MNTRWLSWLLLSLTLLAVCAAVFVYWLAKQAEPVYTGNLSLPGLTQAVEVTFSTRAIPTIHAKSLEDLVFTQGYLEASERMWQMDLMRRIARGKLAEILGAKALAVDRLFRTLGLGRASERHLLALSQRSISLLESYARGVNAYRTGNADRLPLEYRIAGITPAEWSPVDSLSIAEYMAYLLSFNAREELMYLALANRVGRNRILELFPTDEDIPAPDDANQLPDYAALQGNLLRPYVTLARELGLPIPGPASNTWVIAGRHTADGKPLLACDPHLMPSMPGIWYELEMQAPGYHTTGISLPGLPLIVIGHNDELAWGMNTSMADIQDIFVERVTAEGNAVQRHNAKTEDIVETREIIAVKDWTEPHRLRLRTTSNGVILNDVLAEQRPLPLDFITLESPELIALRWNIELPDRAFDGIFQLNIATTIAEAYNAIALIRHASQNILLAHRDGTIAWKMSGTLPLRSKSTGAFPMPGWTGDYGWEGYVPPEDNPGVIDPPSGIIVSANNRTVPIDNPVQVTRSWMPPYRARRIEQLLDEKTSFTLRDMQLIQLDRLGLETKPWMDTLRRLEPDIAAADPEAWSRTGKLLIEWNGRFDADSQAAALFVRLRHALFEAVYVDELGDNLQGFMDMQLYTYGALQETVRTGQSLFWDDMRTPDIETPAQIWARALRQVSSQRHVELGQLKKLVFPHAFHKIPLIGQFFDAGPFSTGGDNHTVNVVKAPIDNPEEPLFIPSYRVVYRTGDWDQTRGTQTLGQSGHRFSPYRRDQFDDWRNGDLHRWSWGGPQRDQILGTLHLLPE